MPFGLKNCLSSIVKYYSEYEEQKLTKLNLIKSKIASKNSKTKEFDELKKEIDSLEKILTFKQDSKSPKVFVKKEELNSEFEKLFGINLNDIKEKKGFSEEQLANLSKKTDLEVLKCRKMIPMLAQNSHGYSENNSLTRKMENFKTLTSDEMFKRLKEMSLESKDGSNRFLIQIFALTYTQELHRDKINQGFSRLESLMEKAFPHEIQAAESDNAFNGQKNKKSQEELTNLKKVAEEEPKNFRQRFFRGLTWTAELVGSALLAPVKNPRGTLIALTAATAGVFTYKAMPAARSKNNGDIDSMIDLPGSHNAKRDLGDEFTQSISQSFRDWNKKSPSKIAKDAEDLNSNPIVIDDEGFLSKDVGGVYYAEDKHGNTKKGISIIECDMDSKINRPDLKSCEYKKDDQKEEVRKFEKRVAAAPNDLVCGIVKPFEHENAGEEFKDALKDTGSKGDGNIVCVPDAGRTMRSFYGVYAGPYDYCHEVKTETLKDARNIDSFLSSKDKSGEWEFDEKYYEGKDLKKTDGTRMSCAVTGQIYKKADVPNGHPNDIISKKMSGYRSVYAQDAIESQGLKMTSDPNNIPDKAFLSSKGKYKSQLGINAKGQRLEETLNFDSLNNYIKSDTVKKPKTISEDDVEHAKKHVKNIKSLVL